MVLAYAEFELGPARVLDAWADLGVPQETLARCLAVDGRTLGRWRAGMVPQRETRQRLQELAQVHAHLLDLFASAGAAQRWLHADSRYLGGLKPIDALAAGRIDRLEAALEAIDSGVFV